MKKSTWIARTVMMVAVMAGLLTGPIAAATEFQRFESPGVSPYGLTHDATGFWNADYTSHRIYRLNADMQVISEFSSPAAFPSGLAWDGESLWQGDVAGEIYQLDSSGEILNSFALPGWFVEGVTFDGGHIWVVDGNARTVNKMTADMQVIQSLPDLPGPHPSGLGWDDDRLVLADTEYQWIYLLDSADGRIVGGGESPGYNPRGLTCDAAHIWNSDMDGIGSLYRIDALESPFGVRMVMPTRDIRAGDSIYADAVIWNPSPVPAGQMALFAILEVYGEYFFYPSFSADVDYTIVDVDAWQTVVHVLPPFTWPQDIPPGEATWYVALTPLDLSRIIGELGVTTFRW